MRPLRCPSLGEYPLLEFSRNIVTNEVKVLIRLPVPYFNERIDDRFPCVEVGKPCQFVCLFGVAVLGPEQDLGREERNRTVRILRRNPAFAFSRVPQPSRGLMKK